MAEGLLPKGEEAAAELPPVGCVRARGVWAGGRSQQDRFTPLTSVCTVFRVLRKHSLHLLVTLNSSGKSVVPSQHVSMARGSARFVGVP